MNIESLHSDWPKWHPPLHFHLQPPEILVWGPGLTESPFHCSHYVLWDPSVRVMGILSSACWQSGPGRAPTKSSHMQLLHFSAILNWSWLLQWKPGSKLTPLSVNKYLQQGIRGQINRAPRLHWFHPFVSGTFFRLGQGVCPGQRGIIIIPH